MTRSDRTDPDDVTALADRLRREAREARGAHAVTVPDPEHTSKIDTDPYAFDTAPTDTAPGPGETPSAENAPELVAALAQFSGRALQEAAFQAASDGRGAARYAVVAAPARSHGIVDPNAGEVIVSPHTTQPLLVAVKPIGPAFAHEMPRASFGATAKMPPRTPDTTIPGLRGRHARARQNRLATIVVVGLALLAATFFLFRTLMKPGQPVHDVSVVSATLPPPLPPTETASAPPPPASAPPVVTASAPPVIVSPVTAPRPSAPRVVAPPAASVPAPVLSTRTAPSAPATSASPKPAPSGKGDFVW